MYNNRTFEGTLDFAKEMDSQDKLAKFRDRFYINPGEIFMDGNSLGLCSKDAEKALLEMLEVWKKETINIWGVDNAKYLNYSSYLAEKMAFLVKAKPEEVAVVNSTTVNIHQLISTFYNPTKEKYKILIDNLNFPTDRYAIESHVQLRGYTVDQAIKVVESEDGVLMDNDKIIAAMTDDVALVFLPSALYRSAQLLDMERITAAAKNKGILIGWDLCHSIGAYPHDFGSLQPDFAVWCTYKYLAAGPGANSGIYVNEKHFDKQVGMAGWFGNKLSSQFQLSQKYDQATGARAFQMGSPSLFSMAPISGVLDIYKEAGIETIREKSLHMSAYLMYMIEERLVKYGFGIGNPRNDKERGGHVCLTHDDAFRIAAALRDEGVIPDFREPNVIRLATVGLYVSYVDIYNLIDIIEDLYVNKKHEKFSNERTVVV